MHTSWLAAAVLVVHAAFVVFVAIGGLLVVRWPRLAWVHLPAAAWGALVELAGWVCPLTPLEDRLRGVSGTAPPGDDFIERLLLPLLYPDWLTRELQIVLGLSVMGVNAFFYWRAFARPRHPPNLSLPGR